MALRAIPHWIRTKHMATIYVLVLCVLLIDVFFVHIGRNTKITSDATQISESSSDIQGLQKLTPKRLVFSVDCLGIIQQNEDATNNAVRLLAQSMHDLHVPDKHIANVATNCSTLYDLGYIMGTLTPEEARFPIAYSILMYKDTAMMERLLRAIYRPQNLYCIHVDLDASPDVHEAVATIVQCFPNVWVVSRSVDVVYGSYTRLEADLNCMEDALARGAQWKYFINLPGTVMPLRTNAEMVAILDLYGGSNDIECDRRAGKLGALQYRVKYKRVLRKNPETNQTEVYQNRQALNPPAPFGLRIVKGSAYGVFSRNFVDYVLHNKTVRSFLEWSRDTYTPDEHVWATLHHVGQNPMLNTPGGYLGTLCKEKPWLATYAAWCGHDRCQSDTCTHGVCVFGIQDLPFIVTKPHFTANKFNPDQNLVLLCLEEWLWNRTAKGLQGDFPDYYRKLPFVGHNTHL